VHKNQLDSITVYQQATQPLLAGVAAQPGGRLIRIQNAERVKVGQSTGKKTKNPCPYCQKPCAVMKKGLQNPYAWVRFPPAPPTNTGTLLDAPQQQHKQGAMGRAEGW